jgi:membrane dipeptidase
MITSRRQFLGSALLAGAGGLMAGRSWGQERKFNPAIEEAKAVALEVLKPKPQELAHGLELHRESIIFDIYGFSPNAAVDGNALATAAATGASDFQLQDMQEDMHMTRHVADAVELAEYKEAWEAAGVTCVFQNAGEEGNDPLRLLKRLARFTHVTDHLRDFVFKAVSPGDIEAAKKQNRRCLCLTGNGVPLAGDFLSVPDELRYLRTFYELGIRMMHVTYNRRNLLGDGCAETANGGLSDLGRAAIAEMNRLGIIVDVAHSGWRTSQEAAEASTKPMVASHTACAGLHHHIRNKPAEVIKAIVEKGGVIGVCCIPNFLGGTADLAALLDHIDYLVQRVGIDHVAIGTDAGYRPARDSIELRKVPARGRRPERYESFWPPDALGGKFPRAASLAWTNWPLFTVGLVQRGYKDEDVQKIVGQNMLRILRKA